MTNTVKRLLLVTHSSERTGGAQDDFDSLLRFLKKYNEEYKLDLVFPHGPRAGFYSEIANDYATYERCHLPIAPNVLLSYYGFLKCFFPQRRIFNNFIDNKTYDKCILNVSVLIWPLLFLRNYKIILFVREDVKPKFIKYFLYKIYSLYVCKIIFVSPKNEREYKKITKKNNSYLILSTFDDSYNYISHNLLEGRININEKKTMTSMKFACIGNIIELKNQKSLIKTLTYMKSKGLDIPQIYLIGNAGSEIDYFNDLIKEVKKNQIEENIIITGHLNKPEYYSVLTKMDAVIIVSMMEGLPIIISEAFRYKIPVISTNVGGIAEIIEDKINGLIINNTNVETITNAITLLSSDRDLRNKIVENAFQFYLKNFNLGKNMLLLKSIIDSD